MFNVLIYTDGACSGNPGPGGWGCVIDWDGVLIEDSGYEPATTNNRMELMAAIKPIEALPAPCNVVLYTDSQYLANAFNQGWLKNWKQNGWRTANGLPVKNKELWERLDTAMQGHTIKFTWVKGHNGHSMNERCDDLATAAIRGAQ